jgi:putative addiction module component (TIGR02574 family)
VDAVVDGRSKGSPWLEVRREIRRALDRHANRAHLEGMPSKRFADALKLAVELPEQERAELVRELVRSLPEDFDEFDREIERRLDEVDGGTAELISWEQAREKILRDE